MNIEYDLKEILTEIKQGVAKIEGKVDKLDEKIDGVSKDLNTFKIKVVEDLGSLRAEFAEGFGELKTNVTKAETGLRGEIKVLAEKMDGLDKRVDTQEFINRGVIVGLILAVLGGFAKIFSLTK